MVREVVVLTRDNWQKEVQEYSGKVVVDFYGNWCAPCKQLEPVYLELAQKYKNIKFGKLDVNHNGDSVIASQYHVQSVPFILAFENGKVIRPLKGGTNRVILETQLAEFS